MQVKEVFETQKYIKKNSVKRIFIDNGRTIKIIAKKYQPDY